MKLSDLAKLAADLPRDLTPGAKGLSVALVDEVERAGLSKTEGLGAMIIHLGRNQVATSEAYDKLRDIILQVEVS